MDYVEEMEIPSKEITKFNAVLGRGEGYIDNILHSAVIGFVKSKGVNTEIAEELTQRLAEEGKTPLYLPKDKSLLGIIAVADAPKRLAVGQWKDLKIWELKL